MRLVRDRKRIRWIEGDTLLSVLPLRPGPTHSVWDVLAAGFGLAPGPRLALLGFAGGGIIAPLRAMGFHSRVEAVDLTRCGEPLFRRVSAGWPGRVRVTRMDAALWLRGQRSGFDLIIEDLSVPTPSGATKPPASAEILPELMRRRLNPRGLVMVNLLPVPGVPWKSLLRRVGAPFPQVRWVAFRDYENRLMIGAVSLPSARRISLRLRALLRRIGSRLASRISVRSGP